MKSTSPAAGVIVADDDSMIRGVLRSKLDALGQTVFLASDGEEAVALASRIKASLIILDISMPRLNGLLACQLIRKSPGNEHTPIVILTSIHEKDAERAAARVGATTFLTKPFASAQLLEVLSRFLPMNDGERHAIRRDATRAAEIAKAVPSASGRAPASSESIGPLDQGKRTLGVLRS